MHRGHNSQTAAWLGVSRRALYDKMRDYGLDDFYLELSTRNPDKSVGDDAEWEVATEALRAAAELQGLDVVLDPGGAAFYGPEISLQPSANINPR